MNSYKAFFQKLYRLNVQKYGCSFQNSEQFTTWQKNFREAIEEQSGIRMLKSCFGEYLYHMPVVTDAMEDGKKQQDKEEGYRKERMVIETLPGVYMPFWVLIPDGVDEEHPARAMLTIPAHGANKNTVCGIAENEAEKKKLAQTPLEAYGKEFAQRGYLVFCPDPPGYGSRLEPLSMEDAAFTLGERSSLDCSCKELAETAEALGLSFMALEVWDLSVLLNYICTRKDILQTDGKLKIGCCGFSGGGQYTMWLAALDERIQLSVISGYVHGYYDCMMESHMCPCNYVPGMWQLGDIGDICSLIAPRPIYIENGIQDVENGPDGEKGPGRQVEKIKNTYRICGYEKNVKNIMLPGKHQWFGSCYSFVEGLL